jgi:lectin family protein
MKSFLMVLGSLLFFCMCSKKDDTPTTKANFEFTAKDASKNSNLFNYYSGTTYDATTQAILLTDAYTSEYGGAFYKFKQDISVGFELEFDFSITRAGGILDCNNHSGGDGMALVLIAQNTITISSGGGLGYSGTPNCLAFEIDTWCNGTLKDPNGNHISMHTGKSGYNDADESYGIGMAENLPDMSDGYIHTLQVTYRDKTLKVYLDKKVILYSNTGKFDMANILTMTDNQVYIGFTASTGSAYERHNLHRFKFRAL